MSKPIEDKINKIPVLNLVMRFFKQIKLPGFENRYAHEALASLLAAVKKAKKFADYQDEYEEIGNSINRPHAIEILHLVDKHGR